MCRWFNSNRKHHICGCGSVGRASDCHSEGRGFEPRQPLHACYGLSGFDSLRKRLRLVNEAEVLQKCLGLKSHDLETLIYASVVQLNRTSGFYPVRRRFESCLGFQYGKVAKWLRHQPAKLRIVSSTLTLASNICPFSSVGIEYLATNQRVGSSSLSTDTTRMSRQIAPPIDFRYGAICGDSSIG